jgi:hypothetical protein
LRRFLDALGASLRASGFTGEPVHMFLAGGLAVNFYCGSRYNGDIDASFSRRLLIREQDLAVTCLREDGREA